MSSSKVCDCRSKHPHHDEEIEYELRRKEMKKAKEAMKKNATMYHAVCHAVCNDGGHGVGNGVGDGNVYKKRNASNSRMNACDITGEEFQIVCEELWIDFKSWVNHNDTMKHTVEKVCHFLVSNYVKIWLGIMFVTIFRWYVGAGRDACSYGFGYGLLSFVCEVLRYIGEVVYYMLIALISVCVGILPFIIYLCIYEFDSIFPDPNGDEDREDDEYNGFSHYNHGHIKKE